MLSEKNRAILREGLKGWQTKRDLLNEARRIKCSVCKDARTIRGEARGVSCSYCILTKHKELAKLAEMCPDEFDRIQSALATLSDRMDNFVQKLERLHKGAGIEQNV